MELKITQSEAERLLLEWAQAKFPDMFNQVELDDRYSSYSKTFTFSKKEPKDEPQ